MLAKELAKVLIVARFILTSCIVRPTYVLSPFNFYLFYTYV